MNKLIVVCITLGLFACSTSTPAIKPLATRAKSQNYYYCESCPQPTKLSKQEYLPLEPDEPVIESKPIVVAEPVIKRSIKPKKYIKHYHRKLKINHKLQCVQWK